MKRLSSPLASVGLLAMTALAGCSGDPRIPVEDRFSESVTGAPGVVLIDDMEDGSQYLISDNGRTGLWYVYNDASLNSTQEPAIGFPMYRVLSADGTPLPGAAVAPRPCGAGPTTPFFAGEENCAFVARSWGTGQRGWGAGVGLDLNGEGGLKNPINASAFGGIGFFAIGNVRGGDLRVNVQDVRTTPESAKAADRRAIPHCDPADLTRRCNDHYGRPVKITTAWQWIEIPFACMTSGGWGFPAVGGAPGDNQLRTSDIVGIQFQISGPDPADTGMLPAGAMIMPFDFSIDNLAFLDKSRVANPPVCP
jgi:hypothetical protein